MLKIGDFSKLSRISIRMLRHYDEIRLLTPASIDDFTGYRYYSETQLPVAGRIMGLRDMGFSLSAITQILKKYDDAPALMKFLELKRAELQEQALETNRQIRLLDTALKGLGKDGTMTNYNVTLKEFPQRYVASLRQVIPHYDQEGTLWHLMMTETRGMNLQQADPCYGLAIFHDEGYKESDVDVEIQMSVKGEYKNTEHVVFKTMPPVLIASATYQGSYEKLSEVNTAVANWLNDNEYEMNGAAFSIYHVSPAMTQNPDELVTEVCYPVRKKTPSAQ